MAKLEQKARKGLYGGFKPGSTGGPGTGKFRNTVKRKTNDLKRAVGDVASNVKEKIKSSKTPEGPTLTINTSDNSNTTIGRDTNPSAADRYNEVMLGQPLANPNAYAAALAGGSRPMTAMDNPQVDPTTGMPITPGGQPNMNPNFIGGMANSNMPTTGMLAQEKYDAAKADLNNNGVTEDWEEAKAKKFTVAQEKKMTRTMTTLPPAVPDKTDSVVLYMGGNAPGQYNNPIYKPAADSVKVRFPNIDPDKIKQSDIYKSGDHLHSITKHIPIANKRYGTEEASKKAYDSLPEIEQQRLTQSRRSTKCMRVKKK